MKTLFLLMAMYDGKPVIPAETVCKDFFPHLSFDKFVRKTTHGEIKLPIVRMEQSQKAGRGVYINDLAQYIDQRHQAATADAAKLGS